MTDHHRDLERQRHTLPVNPVTSAPLIAGNVSVHRPAAGVRCLRQRVTCVCLLDFSPALASTHLSAAVNPLPAELHARLALIKHTAEKVRRQRFTSQLIQRHNRVIQCPVSPSNDALILEEPFNCPPLKD